MNNAKREKITKLCVCAVMLSLAAVLSLIKVWEMPLGGSVTLLSMLPIMLLSIKYGTWGVGTASAFALLQLALGVFSGNVFAYCKTGGAAVCCALFDYLVPFTALAFAGVPKRLINSEAGSKKRFALYLTGMIGAMLIRFGCHFFTGVVIWSQWAPEGQSKYIYSLLYNGQYMLPEAIFTAVGAAVLLKIPAIVKILERDSFIYR